MGCKFDGEGYGRKEFFFSFFIMFLYGLGMVMGQGIIKNM